MTNDKKISIHSKIPISPFIEILRSFLLSGTIADDEASQMLAGYFAGDYVRHRALLHIKSSILNPCLKDFLSANRKDILKAIVNIREAKFICFALFCARYRFAYDIAVEFSKISRLQDIVSKEYLRKNIGNIYGFNENVRRALEKTICTFEDADIIYRTDISSFSKRPPLKPLSFSTIGLWKLAYNSNEPMPPHDLAYEPFFRYLKIEP